MGTLCSDILVGSSPDTNRKDCSRANTDSLPSQTIHSSRSGSFSHHSLFLFLLPFPILLSVRSSAFCFNSSPITSRVTHKVLISSLPPESARRTRTHSHKKACAYTRLQLLMQSTHTRTHTYTHTHTHTHTHTPTLASLSHKKIHTRTCAGLRGYTCKF